ncbi:MAG: hypothetical protein AB8B94_20900 [Hyphomicrobiales bacterium]
MSKLIDAEDLLSDLEDYARLISMAAASLPHDGDSAAIDRGAMHVVHTVRQVAHLLEEHRAGAV